MKIFLTLLLVLISSPSWAADVRPLQIETQSGKIHKFRIEVAGDEKTREQGLMNRKRLPENGGMLFQFKSPDIVYFWMKDTLIPLDILFINQAGVIEKIHPMAKPHDLTQISSDTPIKAALEIKGGKAVKLGIKPGDKVTLKKTFKTVAKP